MARYVVVSQIEEHVRVFGTFVDRRKADDLADRVNTLIEREEQAEWREWDARDRKEEGDDEMAPVGFGRARVRAIHAPKAEDIKRFALGWIEEVTR